MGTTPWLTALTAPRSIALVGVSDDPARVSGRALSYLKRYGYAGEIYAVNIRSEMVQGLPAYRSVADIPQTPDLALISLRADQVLEALLECSAKGVSTAIVYASGFAEQDREGRQLQDDIARELADSDMRVLGPNCLGAVSVAAKMTATFATAFDDGDLAAGPIALLTQSGAFASFVYGLGRDAGVGFGFLGTTGNEMDLTISDLLGGVVELPEIKGVLLHVEGIRDIEQFTRAAERARELGKPIAVIKVGRSVPGAGAALAHTGADVGDDLAYDDLFRDLGVHRVETMTALADAAQVFQGESATRGPRAAIVSVSGGTGVLMADVAVAEGLEVPSLPGSVQSEMAELLPPFASTRNPVDVTGAIFDDLARFESILQICMEDTSTDLLLVAVGNATATEQLITKAIMAAASEGSKPVFVAWVGGSGLPTRQLNEAGIPTFADPSRAVSAAALAVRSSGRPSTPHTHRIDREKL